MLNVALLLGDTVSLLNEYEEHVENSILAQDLFLQSSEEMVMARDMLIFSLKWLSDMRAE